MKRFLILVFSLLLPLAAQAQFFESIPTTVPATCGMVYKDTLVAAADGSKLVTQLYLPETQETFPVVVWRSPYLNFPTGDWMKGARDYAQRGIGVIIQRCRGTGGSEGVFQPNIYEREDGLALLNWLEEASWCKSIGLTGCSYMGLTSWIVADVLPPKVKGIYLEHYGVDRHLSAYSSGLFRQDILTAWAIGNATEPIRKPTEFSTDFKYGDQMLYMPQVTMDKDLLGAPLPWYRDWITHTDYTDPYWHSGFWELLKSIPPKITVPMTIVAGHFDHHMEGTLLGYELLPEETKAKSRLIVGGWDHNYKTTPELPGLAHDIEVNINLDTFEWFHSLLLEEKDPEHEVLVYQIGADKWLHLAEWPSRQVFPVSYFLDADGTLQGKAPAEESALSYTYDPLNPVLSVGGETLFSADDRKGSRLQPPVGYRDDILFFRSEPLEQPLYLSGSPEATVWFSSDCEDTAVAVKISEEKADGSTYNIRTGIATLAFRENKLGPRGTYTPGEIVPVRIKLLPIEWEISAGSRIRVDICSSDFPQYSLHSNYPGVWSEQASVRVAHQTVWTGADHASSITLPFSVQAYLAAQKPEPEKHILRPRKGKITQRIAVFGGSLSVNKESDAAKQIWADRLQAEVTTYGVGGAGFSVDQGCSVQKQVDQAGIYDVYVLWASTNDYTNSRPCGSWQDYTALDGYDEKKLHTQCGGINYCIKTILEKNPKAKIYFFTSLRFFSQEAGHNPFSNQPNKTGRTFAQYIQAQKDCCAYYGIPVLDQFSLQGINEFNYGEYYLQDKLHMNEEGYKKIGPVQADFLSGGY